MVYVLNAKLNWVLNKNRLIIIQQKGVFPEMRKLLFLSFKPKYILIKKLSTIMNTTNTF